MSARPYRHVHLEPASAAPVEPDWGRLDPLVALVVERVRRRRLEASTSTTAPAPAAPAGQLQGEGVAG